MHATIFDWAGLVAETADAKRANVRMVIEREKIQKQSAYRSMMTLVATRAIAAGEQLMLHSN